MIESPLAFHAIEWPAPDASVAGPVVWLRGWLVAKPEFEFVDVRVRTESGVARGVLGLPRADLAQHFGSPRTWLPAGFIVGVPLPNGPATLHLEAQDPHGNWISLESLRLAIAPEGGAPAQSEGEIAGGDTVRLPHRPFSGHLDEPVASPAAVNGTIALFGWLLHETQQIVRLTATCDGLTFWPLHHGLTDDALAQNVAHPAARTARLRGRVPAPPTLATPACLRVFAELADGSAHLCFARRVTPAESRPSTEIAAEPEPLPLAQLPMLPSGRPRRLLLVVRTLRPDDASLRALDVAQFLHDNGRWVVRVVATEDGALRDAFEAAACPAQLLDVSRYVNAPPALASAELASLEPQIWWRHLDAVALFDPVSEWAGELAQRHSLPVFRDPPSALAWFAPAADTWRFDALAPVVAPIRGLDGHGAHLLVAATVGRSGLPSVILTDVRDHPDEVLLRAALVQSPGLRAAAWPDALGGLVNPAFGAVPHHRVLTAAAAGVPVITTPTPLLRAAFPAGEVVFLTPGNPLELAHALLDHAANPTAAARRADAARRAVFARHHPAAQLPRWLGALEAAVAAR